MSDQSMGCEGKTAIITGASRGIGVGIARRLAAEGARVALLARSMTAADTKLSGSLEETAELIRSQGGEARTYAVNLTDPAFDYPALIEKIAGDFGKIDILVNNAAANFYYNFEETTNKRLNMISEANFLAPLRLTQAVIPFMEIQKRGWVVNISTSASRLPKTVDGNPGNYATNMMYGATKAALDRASAGLAIEFYHRNIAFNSLAPQAGVATPAQKQYYPELSEDVLEPLDTMAEAVYLLCSKAPQSLTGKVIRSLQLIKDLGEPVYTLDGRILLRDWQAGDINQQRLNDPDTAIQ